MKAKLALVTLLKITFIYSVHCQYIDSTAYEQNKIEILNNSSRVLKLESMVKKIDFERNYYSTGLKNQTTIFACISSAFFILFGLITYSGFKKEVSELKKEFNSVISSQKKKFKKLYNKNLELEDSLLQSAANSYVMIAAYFFENNSFCTSLKFRLKAIEKITKSNNQKPLKSNIALCLKILNNPDLIDQTVFIEDSEQIFETLDKIESRNIAGIQNELAAIRVKLNEIRKNLNNKTD